MKRRGKNQVYYWHGSAHQHCVQNLILMAYNSFFYRFNFRDESKHNLRA
jgi:hypothetical protein